MSRLRPDVVQRTDDGEEWAVSESSLEREVGPMAGAAFQILATAVDVFDQRAGVG